MKKIHNKNVPISIKNHLLNLEIQKCYIGAERVKTFNVVYMTALDRETQQFFLDRAMLAKEERAVDKKIRLLTEQLKKIVR